jgi:hypothetical protein
MTRTIRILLVFFMTTALSFGQQAAKKPGERPAAFPKVDLSPGSVPYYARVRLDVDTNDVGYVLFDGNVSNGYERIYFWSPDDSAFRTPKVFRYNAETKRFGPVRFSPKNDKDDVKLDWYFGWARHGGAYEHTDYLTGQTVKGNSPIYPRFYFYCDYVRQPRSGARGESLVDITIQGDMNASVWTNMPAPLEPWHTLNFFMGVKIVREKDASLARFDGRLNYGDTPCIVRSLPKESTCMLSISPYMGSPVYSNDVPWSDALLKGVIVKLDYGWYDMTWGMYCPGLRVYSRLDPWVRVNPFPISRFED